MNRFDTEILTTRKNLKAVMDVPGKWIGRPGQRRSPDKLILGLNSSVTETHGPRERLPAHLPAARGGKTSEMELSHYAGVQVNGSAWFGTSFCEKDGRRALILQA